MAFSVVKQNALQKEHFVKPPFQLITCRVGLRLLRPAAAKGDGLADKKVAFFRG
jgi:hypothetical protein